jgi:alkylated DNA repair protein (DNA oxidative demethylase)
MSRSRSPAVKDLLSEAGGGGPQREVLAQGAVLLRGFATPMGAALLDAIERIAAQAPFRNMMTPGGFRMSVAMTNCGDAGWITDRRGYRYDAIDPITGEAWPQIPPVFRQLAIDAAEAGGFAGFAPDACLINRYEPGARLTLHQDKNERDATQPIVSVSLGLPAVFLFGGLRRTERPRRFRLESGDVVVWGGPARMAYHGIDPLAEGEDRLTGAYRFNLTFRKAL